MGGSISEFYALAMSSEKVAFSGMYKKQNPEFQSISSALGWAKRNYWKIAAPTLGVFAGIIILKATRLELHSGEAYFWLAVELVGFFLAYHVIIIFAICVLGPLMDLLKGKRPRI